MKQRTAQKTLFFSYFIPILITILLLSLLFFIYTSRVLRNVEESNLTDISDKMTSIIDSEIRKLNNLSLNISDSSMLKEKINDYQNLKANGYSDSSTEVYLAARDISNILAMTAGPIKTVPQINFIGFNKKLIGSGTYNLIQDLPEETDLALIGIDKTYGKRHFSGSIRDPLAEEAFPLYRNQHYISLFRTIFNEHTNEAVGIIEVKQFAETIFSGPSSAPNNFMIFDKNFDQLFPYAISPSDGYSIELRKSEAPGIISFRNPKTGMNEIISIRKCREINWTILNIAQESDILKPVFRFLMIIIISGIVMFVISISVARRFSRLITDSLGQLNGWITNLHWDNLGSETPEAIKEISPLYEFEDIHREFWKMNQKLHDSMKLVVQERSLQENARMLALQSQMDPHFMYNMLTTIGIMAEDGESENIVETINRLTSILRYTASRSRLYVPLQEEIEISRNYLDCMKLRFGNDLDFVIDLDSQLAGLEFPKLIILPLVENSIKYATTDEPPWKIRVKAEIFSDSVEERWRIIVQDSGSGFSIEALKKIEEILTCCDDSAENQLCFHFDGLGLPNIYSRMMMYFNDDIRFITDNSETTGGACITMEGPIGLRK